MSKRRRTRRVGRRERQLKDGCRSLKPLRFLAAVCLLVFTFFLHVENNYISLNWSENGGSLYLRILLWHFCLLVQRTVERPRTNSLIMVSDGLLWFCFFWLLLSWWILCHCNGLLHVTIQCPHDRQSREGEMEKGFGWKPFHRQESQNTNLCVSQMWQNAVTHTHTLTLVLILYPTTCLQESDWLLHISPSHRSVFCVLRPLLFFF